MNEVLFGQRFVEMPKKGFNTQFRIVCSANNFANKDRTKFNYVDVAE